MAVETTPVMVMLTWRKGSQILAAKTRKLKTPVDSLIASLEKSPPYTCQALRCF
jgi:K+ transporter